MGGIRGKDFPRQQWAKECMSMGKIFRNPHWSRMGKTLILEWWMYKKLK